MSQEQAQAIVDQALESGSLKQRNLIVVITGIMGAGKTCFLCQMFGTIPPLKYTSTGVAEKSFRGLMHHIAKMGSFQILSNEEVHMILAPFLKSAMPAVDGASIAGNLTDVDPLSDYDSACNSFTTSHFSSNDASFQSQPLPGTPMTIAPLPSQTPPEKSSSSESMTIALRSKIACEESSLQLLHVVDTGGQPEFMETMPCVIHNSHLTVLVLNVAQSLDAPPKITFHRKGKGFKRVIPFPLTNRQIIEKLARTMQAKRCILSANQTSKLLVVFSHCDCLWPWKVKSTIATVNLELKKIFIPAFQNELIVYRSVDEIGFPVNCRNPGIKDKRVFQQIRGNISKVNVGSEIEIPPSFLMFEQDVIQYAKQLKREILTVSECVQVGLHLKMSEKVVEAALIYFHQHNIFLYFPKILPNVVFTDPQIPLDFVNNVVAFSYMVNSGEYAALPAEYSISLRNGIVLEEMLNEEPLSSCFVPGIYESAQAVRLFTHLCIIAKIKDEESGKHTHTRDESITTERKRCPVKRKYLMPCMLPIEKNIGKFLPQSPAAVFVVRFKDDCVPNGVFGGSISTLLSKYGWKVCLNENGSAQCMTHDLVTLHNPALPAQITYRNATRHYEVRVKANDLETCKNACPTIQSTIFSAIKHTFNVMHFDSTIEEAFLCRCKLKIAHAAVPNTYKSKTYLTCSITSEPLGLVDTKQEVWLSKTEASPCIAVADPSAVPVAQSTQDTKKKERLLCTEDKPTLPELISFKTRTSTINIVKRIGTHYHELGPLLLHDDDGMMTQAITDECHHNAAKINYEILKRWIQGEGKKPLQWSTLIDVLKEIELSELAFTIEENLQ